MGFGHFVTAADFSTRLDALFDDSLTTVGARLPAGAQRDVRAFWESFKPNVGQKLVESMSDGLRHSFSATAGPIEVQVTALSCAVADLAVQYQKVPYRVYLERSIQAIVQRRGGPVDLAHLHVCSPYRVPEVALVPRGFLAIDAGFTAAMRLSFVPADPAIPPVLPAELTAAVTAARVALILIARDDDSPLVLQQIVDRDPELAGSKIHTYHGATRGVSDALWTAMLARLEHDEGIEVLNRPYRFSEGRVGSVDYAIAKMY